MDNNVRQNSNKEHAEAMTCSLEKGNVLTQPIGYIESCFTAKNGTPRQPSVCRLSRGCLRVSKSVFNNPEHSLMGLQQFSHVWILFIFHKNGHLSCKAKVQPPRLNGAKTGVFSTRSPHRPNAIGLTLAKLDKVEGGTLYLSGIDMIQGTPVIDIKPYIAEYDVPQPVLPLEEDLLEKNGDQQVNKDDSSGIKKPEQHQERSAPHDIKHIPCTDDKYLNKLDVSGIQGDILSDRSQDIVMKDDVSSALIADSSSHLSDDLNLCEKTSEFMSQDVTNFKESKDPLSTKSCVPGWVKDSPVPKLEVRFTPHSEMELRQFSSSCDSGGPSFRYFQSFEEAKCAISNVLSADPRSVYRRNRCLDRLFYFSLDTIHITCWFGDGFAEVLRIQPVAGQSVTKD